MTDYYEKSYNFNTLFGIKYLIDDKNVICV